MALIYSLGLDLSEIKKIVFVEISDYKKAVGSRDLLSNIEICRDISAALGKEFEFYSYREINENIKNIEVMDCLDLRIYMKYFNEFRRLKIKPIFLCLAPELSGIHGPNLLKINYGILKLRVELLFNVFLKFRVFNFYSMGIHGVRGVLFRETPIDWDLFFEEIRKLREKLHEIKPEYFSIMARFNLNQSLLVVLPLAEHFGGSLEFNKELFSIVEITASKMMDCQILVKNHPTDSEDYSMLASQYFPQSHLVVSKNVNEANIPIELLIANFQKLFFAGTFSTSMYSFSSKAQNPALVFIPKLRAKWTNYSSGGALKMFQNTKYII